MSTGYQVPAGPAHFELEIAHSRFIASLENTPTADAAHAFIRTQRQAMPDANHHVYGFRAGFPPSVTDGMSDAGEPSGTGGPPVLAVVRGSGHGDLTIVVTRYFGGTKLGTGGLVRAYTEAAQGVLAVARFELKRDLVSVGVEVPYPLFELARRASFAYGAEILDQQFAAEITLILRLERSALAALAHALSEMSAGSIAPLILDDSA